MAKLVILRRRTCLVLAMVLLDGRQLEKIADGVFFTRDLVNEPSNILTTTEFASRLEGLKDLGVEVEVLEEGAPAVALAGDSGCMAV